MSMENIQALTIEQIDFRHEGGDTGNSGCDAGFNGLGLSALLLAIGMAFLLRRRGERKN